MKLWKATVEFLPGTDVKDAMAFMYDLHCNTRAQVETVFKDSAIVIADNKMVKQFGFRGEKK